MKLKIICDGKSINRTKFSLKGIQFFCAQTWMVDFMAQFFEDQGVILIAWIVLHS